MTRRRRIALLVAVAAALALFFMPLRLALALALPDGGALSARAAGGTIWSGSMVDARVGPLPLGDVATGLRFLPLLTGRLSLSIAPLNAAAGGLSATLERRWGRTEIRGLSGNISGGAIAGLPVDMVTLSDVSLGWSGEGACTHASGSARAMLPAGLGLLTLRNGLTGQLRCQRGDLVVTLTGDSSMERLTLRLGRDGRYDGALTIAANNASMAAALAAAGFSGQAAGMTRRYRGRWR